MPDRINFSGGVRGAQRRKRMGSVVCPDHTGRWVVWLIAVTVAGLLLWLGISPALADSQTLYAAVSAGSTLNVRDKPVTGEVLYTLTRGDAVTVTETRNGWAYVERAGDYGWACLDYLTDTPPTEDSQSATIRSNGRVALRDKPGDKRVGWLQDGDSVTVYGTQEHDGTRWAKVDGGWVAAEYVELF